jgi:hypothetical protein
MKIALLALLGAIFGTLGGAAIGIITGIAWVSAFKTTESEAALVFFTFMPFGALTGGLSGALAFGFMAIRDGQIPISRDPGGRDF